MKPRSDALRARLCEEYRVTVAHDQPEWRAFAPGVGAKMCFRATRASAEDAVLDALGAPRDEAPTVPVPLAQVEALAEAVRVSLDTDPSAHVRRAARALLRSVGR